MNTAGTRPDRHTTRTRNLVLCGMSTVLIVICSYITIPIIIPITLQTFAISLLLLLLGGKKGTVCILLYLLLGACGIPVFHGMTGGIGILFGNTGGYLIGFLGMGLCFMLLNSCNKNSTWLKVLTLMLGLMICYFIGTLWFAAFFTSGTTKDTLLQICITCVFPFIIPDLIKIFFAVFLSGVIKKALPDYFDHPN